MVSGERVQKLTFSGVGRGCSDFDLGTGALSGRALQDGFCMVSDERVRTLFFSGVGRGCSDSDLGPGALS